MKICTKCKVEKSFLNFGNCKKGKNGLKSICKECSREINRLYGEKNKDKLKKYREDNKEILKIKQKEYYKENKLKIKLRSNEWREKNIHKVKEYAKEYYKENKEILNKNKKEYWKIYSKENKEKIKIKNRIWNENNKELNRELKYKWRQNNKEYFNNYNKKRKTQDHLYKLRCAIRSNIYWAFKRGSNQFQKNAKTEEMLGCTIEEFIKYIESKFTEGMTISNHGEWHLDHIHPISLAETEEEIIRLNHYTNFQPLWAEENIRKGNRLDY